MKVKVVGNDFAQGIFSHILVYAVSEPLSFTSARVCLQVLSSPADSGFLQALSSHMLIDYPRTKQCGRSTSGCECTNQCCFTLICIMPSMMAKLRISKALAKKKAQGDESKLKYTGRSKTKRAGSSTKNMCDPWRVGWRPMHSGGNLGKVRGCQGSC